MKSILICDVETTKQPNVIYTSTSMERSHTCRQLELSSSYTISSIEVSAKQHQRFDPLAIFTVAKVSATNIEKRRNEHPSTKEDS